jgi:peptidyl-prolyl cis-trans isomerase B (cyclophilin B)
LNFIYILAFLSNLFSGALTPPKNKLLLSKNVLTGVFERLKNQHLLYIMKELCMNSNPVVTIEMEDGGTVTVELYPETAPNTVNNFINLVSKGYYDGLIFHRVIPGFMIQAGCPQGAGTGGPGYTIKGEFSLNGFTNPLIHDRGVISMARTNNPDSAGSQFFIMTAKSDHLDGMYAAFGRVTSGMETVDKIVNMPKNSMDKPKEDQRMKKVTIDAKGLEYPEPQKV